MVELKDAKGDSLVLLDPKVANGEFVVELDDPKVDSPNSGLSLSLEVRDANGEPVGGLVAPKLDWPKRDEV